MQGEFPQPIVVKSGDATSNKPVEFQPRHDFSSFQVQWERGEVMGQFQPNDSFHDAAEMIDLLERFTIEVVKLDQDRPHAITVEFKYPVGKAGLVDLEAADPEVTMLTLPIGDNFREVPVVFRPEGPSTNLVTYIVRPNDGVFQITNAYPGISNPEDMTNKAYAVNDDTITNLFVRREALSFDAAIVQDNSVKEQLELLDHALTVIRNLSDEYYLDHPKYIIDENRYPTLAAYVRELREGIISEDYDTEFKKFFLQLHKDVIAEAEFIHGQEKSSLSKESQRDAQRIAEAIKVKGMAFDGFDLKIYPKQNTKDPSQLDSRDRSLLISWLPFNPRMIVTIKDLVERKARLLHVAPFSPHLAEIEEEPSVKKAVLHAILDQFPSSEFATVHYIVPTSFSHDGDNYRYVTEYDLVVNNADAGIIVNHSRQDPRFLEGVLQNLYGKAMTTKNGSIAIHPQDSNPKYTVVFDPFNNLLLYDDVGKPVSDNSRRKLMP